MNVSIIGSGYVGLTTGVCFAYLGHEVTCLDTDQAKIDLLRSGTSPIYEPFLTDLLQDVLPLIHFTTSYDDAIPEADVILIAVGTPPMPDGSPNLTYFRAAAEGVGERLGKAFTVVVNKSTVPIGSGNWLGALMRRSGAATDPSTGGSRLPPIRSSFEKDPPSMTHSTRIAW